MLLNNMINHLKCWCKKQAGIDQKVYGVHGGMASVGYLVANEMEWKLSTLIDKSFDSMEDFEREVIHLTSVHYEPSVLAPQNRLAQHMIDQSNRKLIEFFEEILIQKDALAIADIPYTRVIVGPEAAALQKKFRSVWGYVNTSYWFPLMGDEPQTVSEKFFVMGDYFRPYIKPLEQIMGLPQTHLYRYGERDARPQHCIETAEFVECGGHETIYTDKDFSWAIYFSHENTVAFAGSIVPKAKELLSKEKEHWDKFEGDRAE